MKRAVGAIMACVLLLGLCLGFSGCEKSDFPEELEAYLSPWELDVAAEAKMTNTIHYYFMSSNGMFMEADELYPYKWGDACLVVFPDGKTMLVDSGMKQYAPVLVENLRRMKIKRVDYVVLSHQHNDHGFGAMTEGGVFDNFEIGQVYWNGILNSNWKTVSVENECAKRGIPLQILKRGDTLELGAVKAEVLWPEASMVGTSLDTAEDLNNYSIVMRLEYKDHSSLFTGDLYAQGEEWLLQQEDERLDVDLMKVCHHGHATSSTNPFVEAASPEVAVATGYASVNSKVWTTYENLGATLLDDQFHGYIHVASNGSELEFDTSATREEKS